MVKLQITDLAITGQTGMCKEDKLIISDKYSTLGEPLLLFCSCIVLVDYMLHASFFFLQFSSVDLWEKHMNVRPLACVYCRRSAASVNLLIRSCVAQSTANYKLPLIIHFRGCSEADTALSIAQYSRTKALRCTLSVKHSQISKWCFSGAYF